MRYSANGQKMTQWLSIAVVFAHLCILPASAMSLSSTKYTGTIAAGETVTYPITIGLGSNENPANFTLEVMGFGQSIDKGYTTLDTGSDTNPYSARPYISLDKTLIHLNPGTSQQVAATISLPKNVGEGGEICTYLSLCSNLEGTIGNDCCDHPCFYHNIRDNPQHGGNYNQRRCRGDKSGPADYCYYYIEKHRKLSLLPYGKSDYYHQCEREKYLQQYNSTFGKCHYSGKYRAVRNET